IGRRGPEPLSHPHHPVVRYLAPRQFIANKSPALNRRPPCHVRVTLGATTEHEPVPGHREGLDASRRVLEFGPPGNRIDHGLYQRARACLRGVRATPMDRRESTAT